ncbi:MAG: hypothetical protein WDN72_06050 [Alphaproteobacteria bacterium]
MGHRIDIDIDIDGKDIYVNGKRMPHHREGSHDMVDIDVPDATQKHPNILTIRNRATGQVYPIGDLKITPEGGGFVDIMARGSATVLDLSMPTERSVPNTILQTTLHQRPLQDVLFHDFKPLPVPDARPKGQEPAVSGVY